MVTLRNHGKGTTYRVHRLVLENFCPCENMKNLEVNHIDEDVTNNHLSNLEWTTKQENANYGHHRLNIAKARGHKVKCLETGEVYYSAREAERWTGANHSAILQVCKGNRITANNLHWRYANAVE